MPAAHGAHAAVSASGAKRPGAQSTGAGAPRVQAAPSGQTKQASDPAAGWYLPLPQLTQPVKAAAEYFPAAQSAHAVRLDAPEAARYFPAGQLAHAVAATTVLNSPAAQAEHLSTAAAATTAE